MKDHLTHVSPRVQNRNLPYTPVAPSDTMQNEPDTDFDLSQNQEWVRRIFAKWKKSGTEEPEIIPLQIGAETVVCKNRYKYLDRCQNDEVCICEMSQADSAQVEKIIEIAETDPAGWRKTTLEERHRIMYEAANRLADMRGDLIGCMCAVTGKTVIEGDVEVSEAVDYARFYTTAMKKFAALDDIEIKPKGTILVISPWNFPCAIPVGGIVAGLAGGNTVILKPATVAAPVAWMFAKAFWDAGVPKEALQVIITNREALKVLTTAPAIKHIILTGGTDTAQNIARANPVTPLSAETGGKNVIILTASGDRDHAIMNIVASAFGNAGQKCSACSLLLVERSVYEDKNFQSKLKDAATSLKVGSVWNPGNIVGPMITNKNDKLLQAFNLEPGESWLVPPRFIDEKEYMLAPTVKWGVKPENFSFRTELFGPLLSVACIENLEEGIKLVNSLDYGLTSGLQSLDEEEQKLWKNSVIAGNLYINRGITGAIVNRQPFGGMKLSAFGGGIKAGGPNYCTCFVEITDKPDSQEALPIYEKVLQMKDSLVTELSDKQMKLIQSNYHINKIALEEEQLKNKIQLIVLIVIGTTLIVLVFFMLRIFRVRKALKIAESETRKATRIAEKANETKNHFLANMSYNIRIPLNGVVGFSQLIASEPNMDEDTRKEFSAIIQKNTEELMQLVNDVLDLSRLEANMMKFQIQEYDAVALCNDAIYMARMRNE